MHRSNSDENPTNTTIPASPQNNTKIPPTLVFGLQLRTNEFPHHPSHIVRLNNGSFGACPHSVLLKQQQQQQEWMLNPDVVWPKLTDLMIPSRIAVGEIIAADTEDVVLLDNITVASSMVTNEVWMQFMSLDNGSGTVGVILTNNFTYRAVQNAVDHVCHHSGGRIVSEKVTIPFPLHSNSDIMTAYQTKLEELQSANRVLLLAIIDHVSSLPSILFPIEELVRKCREFGFRRVYVDGAHSLGTVRSLDVPAIGADYYAGNVHKWMMAPTAAAFFWTNKRHSGTQENSNGTKLHHPIVSHNYNQGLAEECAMLGTRDYSAMIVVRDAIDFYQSLGDGDGDAVYQRNHNLVMQAATKLTESWGTTIGTPPTMATTMIMVGLPECFGNDWERSRWLKRRLFEEYTIVVQYFFPTEERLWLRLSAAVYNYLEEFDVLCNAVLDLMKNLDER